LWSLFFSLYQDTIHDVFLLLLQSSFLLLPLLKLSQCTVGWIEYFISLSLGSWKIEVLVPLEGIQKIESRLSLRLIASYSRIIHDLQEWNLESFAISNHVLFFYIRYYERTICLNPEKKYFFSTCNRFIRFKLRISTSKSIKKRIKASTI
jgi:hypothetical protein